LGFSINIHTLYEEEVEKLPLYFLLGMPSISICQRITFWFLSGNCSL